jgi:hypothetical protein
MAALTPYKTTLKLMPFDIQNIIDRLQTDRSLDNRAAPLNFDAEVHNGLFHDSSLSSVISILRPRVAPTRIAEISIQRKNHGDWLNEYEISHGLSYLIPEHPEYNITHDSLNKAKAAEFSEFVSALGLIGMTVGHDLNTDWLIKQLNADSVLLTEAQEVTREIFRRPPSPNEHLEAEIESPLEVMRKALAEIERYNAGLMTPEEMAAATAYSPPSPILVNLGTHRLGYFLSGQSFALALFFNDCLYGLTFTDLDLISRNCRSGKVMSDQPTMAEAIALLGLRTR